MKKQKGTNKGAEGKYLMMTRGEVDVFFFIKLLMGSHGE